MAHVAALLPEDTNSPTAGENGRKMMDFKLSAPASRGGDKKTLTGSLQRRQKGNKKIKPSPSPGEDAQRGRTTSRRLKSLIPLVFYLFYSTA
jgi:hypothetical protein